MREIYTIPQIGQQLKEMVIDRVEREKIGDWAFSISHARIENRNQILYNLLYTLSMMDMGHEFYYSYEELERIADDLIAGKEVKL